MSLFWSFSDSTVNFGKLIRPCKRTRFDSRNKRFFFLSVWSSPCPVNLPLPKSSLENLVISMVCGSAEFMGLDDALQREHKRPLSRIITNKAITSKATKTTVEPFAKKPEKREEANIWVKSFQLKVLEISIWRQTPRKLLAVFWNLVPRSSPLAFGKGPGKNVVCFD